MLTPAARMQNIAPFYVMDLLAKARRLEAQGKNIVHMEIGEPDFVTPQPIIEAGIKALNAGETHYTPALGLMVLREAIAAFYKSHHEISVNPTDIAVTPGSTGALQLTLNLLVNPGEEVLMTDPGYPCNKHFVQLAGGKATFIQLSQANNFSVSLQDVKDNWSDKTRVVLLASPSNPTGGTIEYSTLMEIARFAREQDAFLIVDEIYQGLEYEVKLKTMASQLDNVFVINSFSKYFCMTGWRIGWLVAPQQFMNDIDKLAQNIFLSAPTVAQHAALAAFKPESLKFLEENRQAFNSRRDYLYDAVSELGFGLGDKPKGAFYLYADCQRFSNDSYKFCFDLLEQAGVAITPGVDFGKNQAQHFVRFAYTRDIPILQQGMERIADFIK